MRGTFRLSLVAACWLACLCPWARAQGMPAWKLGEGWEISVEAFPRLRGWAEGATEKERAGQRFDMTVIILSTVPVDGHDCVRVQFSIGHGKPGFVAASEYEVLVDVKDGWVRKAYTIPDYRRLLVEEFGPARFLTTAPEGFPLEIFPALKAFTAESDEPPDTVLTIAAGPKPGTRTAVLSSERGKELEIRQVWDDGAKWWRSYERRVKGRLDLRARLVPRPIQRAAVPKAKGPALPRPSGPFPAFVDETNDPLRADRRLQVLVTWKLSNPRASDILYKLHRATGLTFSLDERVDNLAPVFASVTWANMPAWTVMHQVADTPAVQGRWEKQDGGYRLFGNLPPVAEVPSGGVNWWLLGMGVGVLLAGSAFFGMRWRVSRKRRQEAPAGRPVEKKRPPPAAAGNPPRAKDTPRGEH